MLSTYLDDQKKLKAKFLDEIERARLVGVTWEQIGSLSGLGDRRAAQQWYRRNK